MYKFIFPILCLLLLFSCANPQPPSGGPPDTEPPNILSQSIEDRTLNFDSKLITLEFDKYMDKGKVAESIFLSPESKFETRWRGKKLQIRFTDDLSDNTTYILNLGTEYTDLKGNKPADAFSLVFSTGNVIDSGVIAGRIFYKDPTLISVLAYRLDNIIADTLDIRHTKPNYRTQVGSSSRFELKGLPDGLYRLIAIEDKFREGYYKEGTDSFGTFTKDVEVYNAKSEKVKIKVGPPIDIVRPQLASARSINEKEIYLNFSEVLDSAYISTENFIVNDSIGTTKYNVQAAFFAEQGANIVHLIFSEALEAKKRYKVTIPINEEIVPRDTIGNLLNDTLNMAFFTSAENKRAETYEFKKVNLRDSSQAHSVQRTFDFVFNTAIVPNNILENINIIKTDGDTLNIEIVSTPLNILRIKPKEPLARNTWFNLSADLRGLKTIDGMSIKDTIINIHFKTYDSRDKGELEGTLEVTVDCDGSQFLFINRKDMQYSYKQIVSNGSWSVKEMEPGIYIFELFCDENFNEKYDYGTAFPFEHAEPFTIIEKEVEVKARWKIENVNLFWDE